MAGREPSERHGGKSARGPTCQDRSRTGRSTVGPACGYERLGRFLWAHGEIDEAARSYERAASLVSADDRTPGAASVFAGLAQASLMRCQFPAAERWSRRALDICG